MPHRPWACRHRRSGNAVPGEFHRGLDRCVRDRRHGPLWPNRRAVPYRSLRARVGDRTGGRSGSRARCLGWPVSGAVGMAKPLIAKTACCVIATAIMVGSLWPRLGVPGPTGTDILAHAGAYAVLTISAMLGWPRPPAIAVAQAAGGSGSVLKPPRRLCQGGRPR